MERYEQTRWPSLRVSTWILLGFALIIVVGALLLLLPFATREGQQTGVLDALFTATSATCVTGLIIADTWTHWTLFGQVVILSLIQIGGLGFMSIAVVCTSLTHKRLSMRQRLLASASWGREDLSGVVRLTRHVVLAALMIEVVGAVLLATQFVPVYGWGDGIYKGIFHAISAFCNAGFDLMGENAPFSSLTMFADAAVVNLTIALLITLGGLGFFVWGDVALRVFGKNAAHRRLSVHSKLVLVMTAILLLAGTVGFFLCEHSNPDTLGGLPLPQQLLASLFQSATYRTAGFNTIDLSGTHETTTLLSCGLMLVGGSPGSTAGGIKTTTLAIVIMTVWATLCGRRDVTIGKRRVDWNTVRSAIVLFSIGVAIIMLSTFVLMQADGVPMLGALFETTSAYATVGLTQGYTPELSDVSRLCLMAEMYIGRVGVLTLGTGLLARGPRQQAYRYPVESVIVG